MSVKFVKTPLPVERDAAADHASDENDARQDQTHGDSGFHDGLLKL